MPVLFGLLCWGAGVFGVLVVVSGSRPAGHAGLVLVWERLAASVLRGVDLAKILRNLRVV